MPKYAIHGVEEYSGARFDEVDEAESAAEVCQYIKDELALLANEEVAPAKWRIVVIDQSGSLVAHAQLEVSHDLGAEAVPEDRSVRDPGLVGVASGSAG